MIQAYLLTFNCARHLVNPDVLAPSFFNALPKAAAVPDIIVISLQEIAPSAYSFLGGSYLKPYFDRITTTVHLATDIHSHGSERLEHVATRSLGMTALMIFAKPRITERIQWVQAAGAGVGVWNMGNKGAVAMRIGLSSPRSEEGLILGFTAAHFAPMEWNVQARNKDWEDLVRNLVFVADDDSAYSFSEEAPLWSSAQAPTVPTGLFCPGSHLFFAGDLNYRTCDTAPGPRAYTSYPKLSASRGSPEHFLHWLENDQLNRERSAKRTLHGLHELPIDFPPTYKYLVQKDAKSRGRTSPGDEVKWDWATHRYPSWCDRILYLPSPVSTSSLEPQMYTALPIQSTSDHRPVALVVHINEQPLPLDAEDIRSTPPFPINPQWRTRRDAARRCEIIVGVASYLALTRTGNAAIITALTVSLASWFLVSWIKG